MVRLSSPCNGLVLTNEVEETTFDYEEKYAPDEEYKEMGPEARVWLTYLDESKKIEDQRVEEWRDVLDVVLVFVSFCFVARRGITPDDCVVFPLYHGRLNSGLAHFPLSAHQLQGSNDDSYGRAARDSTRCGGRTPYFRCPS